MSENLRNINRLEQTSTASWVDLHLDPVNGLAELKFSGKVTLDLINGSFLKLIDHPSFTTNMNACYDYSDAIIEVNMRDIEAHSQFVMQNLPKRGFNYKLAFVSNETLNNALLNVYILKISKSNVETKIFAKKKQASQWLAFITERNKKT